MLHKSRRSYSISKTIIKAKPIYIRNVYRTCMAILPQNPRNTHHWKDCTTNFIHPPRIDQGPAVITIPLKTN